MEKSIQYAALISSQLAEMFQEDSPNHIDLKELLKDGENIKAFLHALSNIVPCVIYNNWCKENKNNLEWNHIANQLVFENAKFDKEEG